MLITVYNLEIHLVMFYIQNIFIGWKLDAKVENGGGLGKLEYICIPLKWIYVIGQRMTRFYYAVINQLTRMFNNVTYIIIHIYV